MRIFFAIGVGGFVGALLRYGLSELARARFTNAFPYPTMLVNLLGCLMIGALMAAIEGRSGVSSATRSFLTTGLLGSFTTFSTFGFEAFVLWRDGFVIKALAYAVGSLLLGLFAVGVGHALARNLLAS